jgi:hypothetical protein
MEEDGPPYDVAIQIHKGQNGYGIYFTLRPTGIIVTKVDKGSEAELAGVQVNDMLHSVQDLDKKLPLSNPGVEEVVTDSNYHSALELVRNMKYCRLTFKAGTSDAFA